MAKLHSRLAWQNLLLLHPNTLHEYRPEFGNSFRAAVESMPVATFQGRAAKADKTLLVALRPGQVLNELGSRVGRESYFGMIFWWCNSALVGTFERDRFRITFRSRGRKGFHPKLVGFVRPIPGGTEVRYHVESTALVNLAIIGVIGLVALGIVGLVLAAPYLQGVLPPSTQPAAPMRPAPAPLRPFSFLQGAQVVGTLVFFLGGAVAVCYIIERAEMRSLAALLPQMFAEFLIVDVLPAKNDEIADVLPADPT